MSLRLFMVTCRQREVVKSTLIHKRVTFAVNTVVFTKMMNGLRNKCHDGKTCSKRESERDSIRFSLIDTDSCLAVNDNLLMDDVDNCEEKIESAQS